MASDIHRGDPRDPRGRDAPRRVGHRARRGRQVRGVFLATDGLGVEFGNDCVIDTPLTESRGATSARPSTLRPIAGIQFADFIFPGLQP